MLPTEAADQLREIEHARAVQKRILARRSGILLLSSADDLNDRGMSAVPVYEWPPVRGQH